MRQNPQFALPSAIIANPVAAIRHLRANLCEHGIDKYSRDEDLVLEFYVPIDGHHLHVTIVADVENDRNRLFIQTVLLRKLTDDRASLSELVVSLNNRIAFLTVNLLENDVRRLSFESSLLLAAGACFAEQLDRLIGSHIGTLEMYLPFLDRYFEPGANRDKVLSELTE